MGDSTAEVALARIVQSGKEGYGLTEVGIDRGGCVVGGGDCEGGFVHLLVCCDVERYVCRES